MEYNASSVKYRFWFVETRETARLYEEHSIEEIKDIILSENVYQQKDRSRIINEYTCIARRLEAIPLRLRIMLNQTDVATAKLIVIISAMASDRLFFEFMYEVFRVKLHLGDEEIKDSDLNFFFSTKADQNDLIAEWTDSTVKKLRQVYLHYLLEAGLVRKEGMKLKRIIKPYIDPELRQALLDESMMGYLYSLTGEQR